MTEKISIAVVGCGYVAQQQHIPAFIKLENKVDLRAVCDVNESLANNVASRFHIPKTYNEFSAMFSEKDLDIVDICVPQKYHYSLAIEALKQGCHVLIEKPMALHTLECDKMLETAHKQNVKLCVVHNNLFVPPVLKAKKLVEQGKIGDFIGMRILMSDPREQMILRKNHWIHKLPGGLIGETGPHAAYMSLAFLRKIVSVDVYAKNFLEHPWAPFDEFRIEMEGEKAMSSVVISYASNRHEHRVDLLGTDGILKLDLSSMLLVHYKRKTSSRPVPFARHSLNVSSQVLKGILANAVKFSFGRLKLGHEIIITKFVDSVLNNTPPPVTGEEGRETVKVVEMIINKLYEKYDSRSNLPEKSSSKEI